VNESIFRIGRLNKNDNAKINLTNNSNADFKYILIESNREKLIIFNIKSGSRLAVDFLVLEVLSIEGIDYESGTLIGKAVEIPNNDKILGRLQFSIELTDKNITIKSDGQNLINKECFGIKRPNTCNSVNF
jgi:hypothetical protein